MSKQTGNRASRLTVVDAFCGAGGMSLGFASAGFNILYAFDSDSSSLETYKHNFPDTVARAADVRDVTIDSIRWDLKNVGSKTTAVHSGIETLDQLDVLIGGPPCQGFSAQNPNRAEDSRNLLIWEYIRLVKELQPRFFVLENVRGLIGKRGKTIRDGFAEKAEAAGYTFSWKILNAIDFGVAQMRRRVFIIGVRGVLNDSSWVLNILPSPALGGHLTTVREKIHDIANDTSFVSVPNHRHANLSPINELRLSLLKEGEGRNDLPIHLRLPTQIRHADNGHSDTYGRLKWDGPAPTLTTAFHYVSKGRFGHPENNRGLTLREGARLQGFPDSFEFQGNLKNIARQIGNSVSPPVSEAIAKKLEIISHIRMSNNNALLTAFGKNIRLGDLESRTLKVLCNQINDWIQIQEISRKAGLGFSSIRTALTRIERKIEKQRIDPTLILERKWGGWFRIRGAITFESHSSVEQVYGGFSDAQPVGEKGMLLPRANIL